MSYRYCEFVCWKVVDDTEDRLNLNVGSHAIVRTKFGDEEILITRIERVSKAKKKKMGHFLFLHMQAV